MDQGGSATLIFYRLDDWKKEHPLNILAAWATGSAFSHVELAIGEEPGNRGEMKNVVRVFNDAVGVELTQRTGVNPQFVYLQLGCAKQAEQAMLQFARLQRGKPFSKMAMFRSVVWPRQSQGIDYYCSELVAATLQAGGLMSLDSNPGAATPQSLYKLYSKSAATTGNAFLMRQIKEKRVSLEEMRPLLDQRQRQAQIGGSALHAQTLVTHTRPMATRLPADAGYGGYMSAPETRRPRNIVGSMDCHGCLAAPTMVMGSAERGIRNAVRRSRFEMGVRIDPEPDQFDSFASGPGR